MPIYFLRSSIFIILLLLCSATLGATTRHTKQWTTAIIQGFLPKSNQLKYYIQPRLALTDNKYKFNNALIFLGLGYQANQDVTLWLIGNQSVTKNRSGKLLHRHTLREQMNWTILKNDELSFTSTSRFDQRKQVGETQWGLMLRQQLALRLPFHCWEHHSLYLFDEVFFELNHPKWFNSNRFMEQNRAYIGIGSEITKHVLLDVGYLNQYVMRNNDRMSNVLYMIFNVNA